MASPVPMEICLVRLCLLSPTVPVRRSYRPPIFIGLGRGGYVSGYDVLLVVVSVLHNILCHLPNEVPSTVISWYKRSEPGSRLAVVFSAAAIAGAFSVYITLWYRRLTDNPPTMSGGFLAAMRRYEIGIVEAT